MAICSETLVLTSKDWIRAGDLRPGDYVYGMDGQPAKILSVQNYTPTKMYSVLFDDGFEILADKHQAFPLEDTKYRINLCEFRTKQRNGTNVYKTQRRQQLRVKTVEQLLKSEDTFSIPLTQPIAFRHQDLPVHPMIAGFWFGYMLRKNYVWLFKDQFVFLDKLFRLNRFKLKKEPIVQYTKRRYEVAPNIGVSFLTDNRFPVIPTTIPKEYMFGTPEQRIDFLKGYFLYRPSKFNVKKQQYNVTSKDTKLLKTIRFMAEGLGMKTKIKEQPLKGQIYLTLSIRGDIPLVMDHKPVQRVAEHQRRYITDIEEVPPVQCTHIKAERPFIIGTEGFAAIC